MNQHSALECLLEYEIRCAFRYRRYVSLLMFSIEYHEQIANKLANQPILRDSDVIFRFDKHFAILLSETDQSSARSLLERLKKECHIPSTFHHSLVCYPYDGMTSLELIEKANKMLHNVTLLSIQ